MTTAKNTIDTSTHEERPPSTDLIPEWALWKYSEAVSRRSADSRTLIPRHNDSTFLNAFHSSQELLDKSLEWVQGIRPIRLHVTADRNSAEHFKSLAETLFTSWLSDAKKHKEIIFVLRLLSLDKAANRISYLQRVIEDDPDEVRIELGSLRHLASFIITERQLPSPRIAVSPDGLMQIEWRTEGNGIIAMKFLLDGKIQFAGVAGRVREDIERERISGTLQKDDMMRALGPFTSRLWSE